MKRLFICINCKGIPALVPFGWDICGNCGEEVKHLQITEELYNSFKLWYDNDKQSSKDVFSLSKDELFELLL